jgi:hypothetical protein
VRIRSYSTLYDVGGVYVAQFAGWVKVGMSSDLRMRMRTHGKQGATRARAWSVEDEAHRVRIEADVLSTLFTIGQLVRGREGFAGVTFGQAVDVMRSSITWRYGGPAHELDGFAHSVVFPMLNPSTNRHYGWDGSHLLEVAS